MDTTADFKLNLEARGFQFRADGDALYVDPRAKLSPDDIARIKSEKAALLALLAAPKPTGKMPSLLPDGGVRIGFDCAPEFQWWKPEGQSLAQTLADLDAPAPTIRRYLARSDTPLHRALAVRDCAGEVVDAGEVSFCVGCGYYAEKAQPVMEHQKLVEVLGF